MRHLSVPPWRPYAGSVLYAVLATWIGGVLVRVVGIQPAVLFATAFAAVVLSGWYGGLGPALVATALTYLLANWFLVPAANAFEINSTIFAFVFVCVSIAAFSEMWRRALRRANAHAEQIRSIAESITDGFVAIDSQWRLTYMNRAAEEVNRRHHRHRGDGVQTDAFPLSLAADAQQKLKQAAADRATVDFETFHEPWRRWFEIKASPSDAGGLTVYFRDITERRLAEDALREADRRKDEFLATLAHELRNPLTPISNALELWPLLEDDPVEMTALRSMMEPQVKQLVRLIDDLMDVSRITQGKIHIRKQPVEIGALIGVAVESVRPMADGLNQTLRVSLPAAPIVVDGDAARLTQVFANIVNNASKYTGRDGTIAIEAVRQADSAVVKVRDNGPGIPRHMLSEVFDAFRQVETTVNRSHGGLGIGLTLVKRLVVLHGGNVDAHSEGPGTGCEFVVTLPALAAHLIPGNADRPRPSLRELPPVPSHLVLVVDDVAASAKTLAMMLTALGQEVVMMCDGRVALQWTHEHKPDIVFLDIAMPGMDGYQVAEALRNGSTNGALPVLVALTGFGQEEDRKKARESGFNHHITKPVSIDTLHQLLSATPVAAARTAAAHPPASYAEVR
jgi:signal transduction histidine kinase/ActR/RegA family two-component response regulator